GESTIVHELTHIFDLLNWLTESDPVSIYAVGGRSDNNVVTLVYPGGVAATIVSGGCGTEGYPKERMEIFSGNSALLMNDFVELECTRIDGEQDQCFPVKSNPGGKRDLSGVELRNSLRRWRDNLTPEEIKIGYYYGTRVCVNKGHYEALDNLRQCIADERPVETDAYRGAVATIMGLKALESLRSGQAVELEFDRLKHGHSNCLV
ncbi:MAG: hypothetical protein PHT33_08795, partial [bacterium]|nr:hypothetical protein [bacterium]